MVTPKQEREVIFPVWLTSYFTVFAVIFAIALGALLYFKSPGSMRTSPNAQHNVVEPGDKTNAPHFTPTRDVGAPKAPAGTSDGQLMAPGRYMPAPAPGGLGSHNKDFRQQAPSDPVPETAR